MASFIIEGGHRLNGDLIPQGAKNEALEVLCATLLTPEEVKIYNIPDILDVNNLIQLLRDLGVTVKRIGLNAYSFKADKINLDYLDSDEFFQKGASLRGSVMIIGPLVARFGYAVLPKPGGDVYKRQYILSVTNFSENPSSSGSSGVNSVAFRYSNGSIFVILSRNPSFSNSGTRSIKAQYSALTVTNSMIFFE